MGKPKRLIFTRLSVPYQLRHNQEAIEQIEKPSRSASRSASRCRHNQEAIEQIEKQLAAAIARGPPV